MSALKTDIAPTDFKNVQVTAIPVVDPKTGNVTYNTTFSQNKLTITQPDTVINYQLINPTPADVIFKSVKIKQHTDQLSPPSISLSGKLVTFSDQNSVKETISLTFYFTDKDGVEFNVDPDLENEPDPHPPMLA